ncbi:hypothetical protein [Stenotrophomonas sp. 22385]|uniref:hypothetical protein n=1 Tax=Stenotrophomonas sp. 22385 TaxID=3453915 RepID=UPI003F82ADB8
MLSGETLKPRVPVCDWLVAGAAGGYRGSDRAIKVRSYREAIQMRYRALRIDQLQQGVCLAYRELALDIREREPGDPATTEGQ